MTRQDTAEFLYLKSLQLKSQSTGETIIVPIDDTGLKRHIDTYGSEARMRLLESLKVLVQKLEEELYA